MNDAPTRAGTAQKASGAVVAADAGAAQTGHADIAAHYPYPAPISRRIFEDKYRLSSPEGLVERDPSEMFARVARTAAEAEMPAVRAQWAARFEDALSGYRFLPAGRILAGAGSGRAVTLFNCFVMGPVEDSIAGIFENVKQSAATLQTGGGIGIDFSTLRPRGAPVKSIGADAAGPVCFMDVWDAMCRTIMSAGSRRGAMMATLRADHPDIEDFITAKAEAGRLTNFNLSVLVPDALMEAVANDGDWDLVFDGTVARTVRARDLWRRIMEATFETSEPGVIFIDRVNAQNNLAYCETIHATNPCGEQPLPPYGACLLGSFNLTAYVLDPFSDAARLDLKQLGADVHAAVRLLDNLIDLSRYPLEAQRAEAVAKRRMGLGVTGLADALIFLGLHYDSEAARTMARGWMSYIQAEAYAASADLASEKGPFPLCDVEALLAAPNLAQLPRRVRDKIRTHGLRNGCLTSIAPTGTISLLAGNVSSGVEPVFDLAFRRHLLRPDGTREEIPIEDFAYAAFRRLTAEAGEADRALPKAFVTARQLSPSAHLAMQDALQPYVDSAISKTINCPEDIDFAAFETIYLDAYARGLKGCTTYRPTAVRGAVLTPIDAVEAIEPEAGPQTESEPFDARSVDSGVRPGAEPDSALAIAPGDDTARAHREGIAPPDQALLAAELPQAIDAPITGSPVTGSPVPGAPAARAPGIAQPPVPQAGGIVYMAEPLARDRALAGVTYKLKWPDSDHAIYVTLNDIERDGRRRPFEIFINTRNLEHYAWTVALTRMISAVFRRGGDVSFVAQELKAVFDPQGGRWIGGRYIPSLLAAIGDIIEEHLEAIGFTARAADPANAASEMVLHEAVAGDRSEPPVALGSAPEGVATNRAPDNPAPFPRAATSDGRPRGDVAAARRMAGRSCPRCGLAGMERQGGCWVCRHCGHSKCD